ncbi:MAG: glucuronate isomerase [Defluviitaleaceae bacterium]|nr:glucuronate isomerase [Defluviitaleaceae bacterium]
MPFIDENFLLKSDLAVELYESVKSLPIVDYHCHLDPAAIYADAQFENINRLWLAGDHYKWRLMRANGVAEELITGGAPEPDKFKAWCETIAGAIGNPLYHWAHLELKRYFDIDDTIDGGNWQSLYCKCNEYIKNELVRPSSIINKFNVEMIGTTDDPADTLSHHMNMKCTAKVLPTFRPGIVLKPDSADFAAYIKKLAAAGNSVIECFDDLLAVLSERIDFFNMTGCVSSDHSLEPGVPLICPCYTDSGAAIIFAKALRGEALTEKEKDEYKTRLLVWLGGQYKKKNWVMQLHIGALRNNNTRMFKKTGADSGFDSMCDIPIAIALSSLLDAVDQEHGLPKTVIYSLNPAFDDILSAAAGNFQTDECKVQWGCPWWFNDHKTGIKKHLTTTANHGMLPKFIGMLTDSRSFMSYTRHEYFRRILAQTIASWVNKGEYPNDTDRLISIMKSVAYSNAKEFFSHA